MIIHIQGLNPLIWLQDGTLNPVHKDFVLKLLNSFYINYNFKEVDQWVLDVTIIGSLTTNKYLLNGSDFDCHVLVNIDKFIETNTPKSSKEEALDILDQARREWDRAKILMNFTSGIVMELFFESPELNPASTDNCGRYSLISNTWIKEPIFFKQDDDFESTSKKVIEEAKKIAGELDATFANIAHQIQRVDELRDVLKAWPTDKQQLYYKKIQEKLDEIEKDIEKSIQIKENLVNERHDQHDLLSDVEVRFKFLTRFMYFSIINELKAILDDKDLSVEDLPLIEKVISEASLSKTAYGTGWWMSPDGSLFEVESSHFDWVLENASTLGVTYPGEDLENPFEDLDDDEKGEIFRSMMTEMFEKGWVRFKYTTNELNVDLLDTNNIPKNVDNFIVQHPAKEIYVSNISDDNNVRVDYDTAINLGLQKAVNKALSHKRLQHASLKQAFLKEAFEESKEAETDICVDLDQTIAQDATFPAIGEPIEGAKESLAKLQEMGYNVVIYSCRADSEEGLELVREWLDKHEIPYDSIFEGEKPFSKYFIDDKAIHFDSWKNVLKQVEKSDKTASLHIVAYDRANAAFWVDPSGKVYPVKTTHEDWFFENEQLLRTQYHYDKDEIGQDWWDIKTGNLVTQLLEDGWLRVGDLFAAGRKSIGTGIEIGNLQNIPSTLIDFVSNWGKDKYFQIEDLQRRVVELSVEELMADGQEAIDKALQRERMQSRRPVHASFDLQIIDPKTLNRKEPYALFIGTQWNAKHTVGVDLFNIYPMANADNYVPTVGLQTLVDKNIPVIGKEPRAGDKQPAQDISGLYKQALKKEAAYNHAYWIDPHGKVFQVRGEGATAEGMNRGDFNTHSDWVRANIDMLVKEYGFKAKPAKSEELFSMPITSNDLIAADWIRIGDSSGGSEWGVTLKDLNYIPQSVDNLLAQFVPEGARITVEEDTSWQNSVQIEWPVNSVQLAVNQARRQQPVMASKAFSKKEITARTSSNAWLMDPKGKLYPAINDDHQETIDALAKKGIVFDFSKGWSTIRTIGNNVAFAVGKLNNIPEAVQNYLDDHSFNNVEIIPADTNLEGLSQPGRCNVAREPGVFGDKADYHAAILRAGIHLNILIAPRRVQAFNSRPNRGRTVSLVFFYRQDLIQHAAVERLLRGIENHIGNRPTLEIRGRSMCASARTASPQPTRRSDRMLVA